MTDRKICETLLKQEATLICKYNPSAHILSKQQFKQDFVHDPRPNDGNGSLSRDFEQLWIRPSVYLYVVHSKLDSINTQSK